MSAGSQIVEPFRPRLMRLFDDVEVKAKATSSWNVGHIHKRLADLEGRTDEDSLREVRYLKELLEKQ